MWITDTCALKTPCTQEEPFSPQTCPECLQGAGRAADTGERALPAFPAALGAGGRPPGAGGRPSEEQLRQEGSATAWCPGALMHLPASALSFLVSSGGAGVGGQGSEHHPLHGPGPALEQNRVLQTGGSRFSFASAPWRGRAGLAFQGKDLKSKSADPEQYSSYPSGVDSKRAV